MKNESTIPGKMREKYDAVWSLIEPFCNTYLNDECRGMCQQMLGVLARKRPSPIVNGTAAAWACGIVRAIARVNFLDDKTQSPHMKMTDTDKVFGVSTGTGQGKSKAICDMLKINPFDPEWTLPSRLDDNPMVWMLQVNGMLVDARYMPREVQVAAFERGIIPYIPADRRGEQEQSG